MKIAQSSSALPSIRNYLLSAEHSEIRSQTSLPCSFVGEHSLKNPFSKAQDALLSRRIEQNDEESKVRFNPQTSPKIPCINLQEDETDINAVETITEQTPKEGTNKQEITITPKTEAQTPSAEPGVESSVSAFQMRLTTELQVGFADLPDYIVPISEDELSMRMVTHLPPTKKKTLLLDLDETLIHAVPVALSNKADLKKMKAEATKRRLSSKVLTVHEESDLYEPPTKASFMILIRPFARKLLKTMSRYYDIIIFTASKRAYAEKIVAELDPNHEFISELLCREHCVKRFEYFEKDPRIMAGRHLKDVVLVDNQILSFGHNLSNGIYVASFYGDSEDHELERLIQYLKGLSEEEDVRKAITKTGGLKDLYLEYLKSKMAV